MRAAGAEALLPESSEHVEDGEWIKVEWYVLISSPFFVFDHKSATGSS